MCGCCSAYTVPTPSAAAAAAPASASAAVVGVAALPHQVIPQLRAGLQQLLPSCCKPLHIVLAAGSAGARLVGCCHCIGQFLQDTTSGKLDHKPGVTYTGVRARVCWQGYLVQASNPGQQSSCGIGYRH